MLKALNLTLSYKSSIVLDNISFQAEKGRLIALVGTNGSGKTTLLKALAGIIKPAAGNIEVLGHDINRMSVKERSGIITFLSTYRSAGLNNLTAEQIVSLGRYVHKSTHQTDKQKVWEAMELTGSTKLANKKFSRLSDGEKQKVLLAKTIAQDSNIILLDEPLSFLDYINKPQIVKILDELSKKRQKLIIFSTHEIEQATQHADSFLFIENKKIKHIKKSEELKNLINRQLSTI